MEYKTISWKGQKGNIIELRAYCKIIMVDNKINDDGYVLNLGRKPFANANLELIIDGKIIDSCYDIDAWRLIDIKDGLKKIWGLPIAMSAEQAEIVDKFLKDVVESGKSDEVKAYEAQKAAEKKEKDRKEAQKIISKVDDPTKLMTNAEYREWAKKYNDINNEGGDGYIPEKITKEQYEWAKKILSEN